MFARLAQLGVVAALALASLRRGPTGVGRRPLRAVVGRLLLLVSARTGRSHASARLNLLGKGVCQWKES